MAFKSKVSANISNASGSPTTVTPTVAATTTLTIIGMSVANTTGSDITVNAKLIKADASNAHIVKSAPVSTGGTLILVGGDQKIVLETGDSITAWSSAASSADVIISYLV